MLILSRKWRILSYGPWRVILAYANITQPSRASGEDVSGERAGKLCGTVGTTAHKCQDMFPWVGAHLMLFLVLLRV